MWYASRTPHMSAIHWLWDARSETLVSWKQPTICVIYKWNSKINSCTSALWNFCYTHKIVRDKIAAILTFFCVYLKNKIGQPGVQFLMNEVIYMKWIIYSTTDLKSSQVMLLAVKSAILAIAKKGLKNSELQRGLNPWPRHAGPMLKATETWSHRFIYHVLYRILQWTR